MDNPASVSAGRDRTGTPSFRAIGEPAIDFHDDILRPCPEHLLAMAPSEDVLEGNPLPRLYRVPRVPLRTKSVRAAGSGALGAVPSRRA